MKTRRRDFFRLMAAAGGALALPRFAFADGLESTPDRFVVVTSTNGCVHETWRIRPNGEPETESFEFDLSRLAEDQFSESLRPLYRHRHRITVLDGLSLLSGIGSLFGPHSAGATTALTGRGPASDVVRTAHGPSIDRLIAESLQVGHRIRSIDVSVDDEPMIFGRDGQAVPVAREPEELWSGLLSSLTADSPLLDRLFSLSHGREARAVFRVEESIAVEQYLDVMSSAIQRYGTTYTGPVPGRQFGGTSLAQFGNLLQGYFCTDATRVATMQTRTLDADDIGAPPGDVHGLWAHNAGTDPVAQGYMTEHARVQAERFAEVLDALEDTREGEGTLLDSTTVLWVNELGGGEHTLDPWPVVIAGGRKFRQGRYLRWAPETVGFEEYFRSLGTTTNDTGLAGVPNQRLLVRLAEAFELVGPDGRPLRTFGDQTLQAVDGSIVDLSGALSRL